MKYVLSSNWEWVESSLHCKLMFCMNKIMSVKLIYINWIFVSNIACRENEFQCRDGTCIPENNKCDRKYDCVDGSDEMECDSRQERRKCRQGEFTCDTGDCVTLSRRCDQRIDCQDGSDEKNCCKFYITNFKWLNINIHL